MDNDFAFGIITLNEARNLSELLPELVAFEQKIYILDSHSSDETIKIAEKWGCNVATRKFDNYALQRNHLLDIIYSHHRNTFILDADERISKDLFAEIIAYKDHCTNHNYELALEVPRRNFFGGKEMKFAMGSDYQTRVFLNTTSIYYENPIHEVPNTRGVIVKKVKTPLLHNEDPTIYHILDKFFRYVKFEIEYGEKSGITRLIILPPRNFFKSYVLKKGFLDGWQGLVWNLLSMAYTICAECGKIMLTKNRGE